MVEEANSPLAEQLKESYARLEQIRGPFPKPVSAQVLTVSNQKGGVGKTTSAVNLAAALADGGWNVVVVDADPQGNASTALGVGPGDRHPSTYDVLVGQSDLAEAIRISPEHATLRVCPATIDLAGAEVELANVAGREYLLADAVKAFLEANTDVDLVMIDCPPSLGLLTLNALVAADEVLIPVQAEYYALEGLSMLTETVSMVKGAFNPGLVIGAMLITMADGRTRLSADVAAEVRAHFPGVALQAEIPRSVRISEAPSYGQTAIAYDPRGTGAVAYRAAAFELANRMGSHGEREEK